MDGIYRAPASVMIFVCSIRIVVGVDHHGPGRLLMVALGKGMIISVLRIGLGPIFSLAVVLTLLFRLLAPGTLLTIDRYLFLSDPPTRVLEMFHRGIMQVRNILLMLGL